MPSFLDLDFRSVMAELRSRNYVASREALGAARVTFRANEHGYRRIDDHSFLHVMNFEARESFSLTQARTDLVCFQILIAGSYSRSVVDRIELVTPNAVLVSNCPQSTSDVQAGMKLRGVLIVIERQHLLDHFKLNVDKIPAAYRPIFLKKTGVSVCLRLPPTVVVMEAVDQLLSCKFGEPLRSIYTQLKATEIICEIVAQINALHVRGQLHKHGFHKKPLAVATAAAIYRREVSNPPTIEQLAARVGLNRNDLTAGFRDLFGKTPHAYGNMLRMEQAQNLLNCGELSISEIARQVGYDAYSGFARAFHSHFGRSPSLANGDPPVGTPDGITPAAISSRRLKQALPDPPPACEEPPAHSIPKTFDHGDTTRK
ncbi:helix-turn-helix transcriptional regulator [Mesorhizobium koreense]|uniref:helix-turn-helix transcriptional regulator n=1 Tax=Mesorhizobium koreense TaxID=3074855 RepID=UPI00287B9F2F|nr:AraC family transcriptional regulator [Mesorhizobium sp. WR6]